MKKQYIIAAACCAALIAGTLVFAFTSVRTDTTITVATTTTETTTSSEPTPGTPTSVNAETGVVISDTPATTSPSTTRPNCVPAGCSGQLCVESSAAGNVVSTCEYRASYACYKAKSARCERQANGQCGWTQTTTLVQCLKDAESAPANGTQPR